MSLSSEDVTAQENGMDAGAGSGCGGMILIFTWNGLSLRSVKLQNGCGDLRIL